MNVTFILSNWTYVEYNDFLQHLAKSEFRLAGHLVEKIVADWSAFDIPEGTEHPIDILPMDVGSSIVRAAQAKIKEYTESLDVENDVIVDLAKWKWSDFYKFQEVAKAGNIVKASELMLEVTRLKKGHPKSVNDMNAVQGMVMYKALSDAMRRVFSGGN